ncbi:MAG: SpoVA/SpoVAEb family sporulation membrane protein [Oscillospiraceae bacterium]|jgi:stage V sporulation protein AC|nr:SpoVA/SpoVAEb family sporulation membrane protein [Oscillospiraceae bacterium]
MINMSKKEYGRYVRRKAPASRPVRNGALAWLVGGGICVLGQFLSDAYLKLGLTKDGTSAAVAISLVTLSAILTAARVYGKIAKWAGGGTLIPITGFANAMVSPAMEFKSEGYVAGLAARMFSVAGPVLVYGLLASVLYGFVLECIRIVSNFLSNIS